MNKLELKIPPVVLVSIFLGLMWGIARVTPKLEITSLLSQGMALIIVLVGVVITLSGAYAFNKAQTTVNPLAPEQSSSLVNFGIYKFTRNPMYLGFLLFLIGWGVYLASAYSLLVLPMFILYMNAFQISPEERALANKFGEEFEQYKTSVRRWL